MGVVGRRGIRVEEVEEVELAPAWADLESIPFRDKGRAGLASADLFVENVTPRGEGIPGRVGSCR